MKVRSMKYNELTSWWIFHFQEFSEYKSLRGNLEECSRFLIDIEAKRASNLYIDE